jgi:hypothetical protein
LTATSSSKRGCLIAFLVVFGIVVVLGIIGLVLAGFFVNRVDDKVIGETGPCPFLSDSDAAAAFGDGTTAQRLEGLSKVLVIIDARVMPEDPSCSLTRDEGSSSDNGSSGGIGRIARYKGSRASAKFADERTKAKGISEDRGNGITVTSDEYFNEDVDGIGDEAFCTTSSGVGAGVLVREGDTLVYVSLVADVTTAPGVDLSDPDNPKLGTDDLHCEIAQRIARKVLG